MRYGRSLGGFGLGVLVGVLLGSAAVAAAAFGYSGWQRFSQDFKVGYLTGYLDMANITRNLDPGGWVDDHYPYVPAAKPLEWAAKIDELYKEPDNQGYPMTSMLQLAAHVLEKKYGKASSPEERARRKLEQQMKALQQKEAAKQAPAKDAQPQEAEAKGGEPKAGDQAAAVAKTAPVVVKTAPPRKRERKWCRCDGTDPKAARERRRAEAAEAEKAEEKTDGGKTPPAAPRQEPSPAR